MALIRSGTAMRQGVGFAAQRLARMTRVWVDDLLSFVPAGQRGRWRRVMGLHGPLVLEADMRGDFREVGGSESALEPERIRDQTRRRLLALRIDDTQILRRRLDLPRAAVERLDAALDTNLAIWTPFAASDVYAAAQSLEPAWFRPEVMRSVELRCVPRPHVDEQIAALRALGLDPDAIELGNARFTLPQVTRKRIALRRRSWLIAGLVLLLLGQTIGVYAVLTNRQRDEIDALAAARTEIVATLRHRADADKETLARREGTRRIAARLDATVSISRALQILAAVVPPEAVVRELEFGRERAEGHVALLGPAGLDVVALLSTTGFYRIKDLSILPGNDPDRKVFSASVALVPWSQADGRAVR